MAGDSQIETSRPNAAQEIQNHEGSPLVIEFLNAPGSHKENGSKTLSEDLEKFEDQFGGKDGKPGRVAFVQVNADREENQELLHKYNVTVLPALIYKDKEGVKQADQKGAYKHSPEKGVALGDVQGDIITVKPPGATITNDEKIAEGLAKIVKGESKEKILEEVKPKEQMPLPSPQMFFRSWDEMQKFVKNVLPPDAVIEINKKVNQ